MTQRLIGIAAVVPLLACYSIGPEYSDKHPAWTDQAPATGGAKVSMAAGNLYVCGARGGGDHLLSETRFIGVEPEVTYRVASTRGLLRVEDPRSQAEGTAWWRLCFDDRVPIDLEMALGDVDAELSLEDVELGSLDLTLGSGNTHLELGERGPDSSSIRVLAGSGNLEIEIDDDVGVRMIVQHAGDRSGQLDLGDEFVYRDGAYISDAMERDPTRVVNLLLVMGSGHVEFEEE